MKNFLSIILPLYNAELYIEECITSILNSSYDNLEVIVVDDGSTDGSAGIVKEIVSTDKRVKLISQENSGVSSARNLGVQHASGDFIAFVDADDYIESDTYEKAIASMNESESEAAIYAMVRESDSDSLYEALPWATGTVLGKNEIREKLIPLTLASKRGEIWVSASVWRVVVRREILETVTFDEEVNYREDLLFCLSLYMNLSSIVINNDAKYHYVKHGITTTEKYRECFFKESLDVEKKVIRVLQERNVFESVMEYYKMQRLSVYSLCISNLFRYDAPKKYVPELKEIIAAFKKDTMLPSLSGGGIRL